MIDWRKWARLLAGEGRFDDVRWKGDLFGGLTTAVISLPLALAFGVASGAGAQAGLYGAVVVGLFAALFGGTRTLISEPTGPMTVVMTAVVTQLIAAHPENGLAMAFAVVLVAGITQVLLGGFRLGRYVTLMPYSVISGFMSGIGILLILMQLGPLTGQSAPVGGAVGVVLAFPELWAGIVPSEALLAVIALVVLFLMPQTWRRWCPPHLLALVLGSVAAVLFFGDAGLRRIGEIPMGLPRFQLPVFAAEELTLILFEGMVLGLLGSIDTLLTAMIADSLTRKNHDSNRELIGQGVGNCVASLCGGLPGAGATMGTVVNIQVGARSPVAGSSPGRSVAPCHPHFRAFSGEYSDGRSRRHRGQSRRGHPRLELSQTRPPGLPFSHGHHVWGDGADRLRRSHRGGRGRGFRGQHPDHRPPLPVAAADRGPGHRHQRRRASGQRRGKRALRAGGRRGPAAPLERSDDFRGGQSDRPGTGGADCGQGAGAGFE